MRKPDQSSNAGNPVRDGGLGQFLSVTFLDKTRKAISCRSAPATFALDCWTVGGSTSSPRTVLVEAELLSATPLNTYPHHLAPTYRIQLRHADPHPRCFKVIEQYLRDVFGQGFQQIEMAAVQHALDLTHDIGIVEGVLDVVGLAGAAVGQGDLQIELQGLRHALFPFVHADECIDLEFAQKNDVHRFR